jgi:TPR repeat protein
MLGPSAAGAQTTTADGIQALTRGDYATAARILRPLAEDAATPDPLALFFMAILYESGRGVAANSIRACGLYLKAATPTNPLLTQSLALARMIRRDHPFLYEHCVAATARPWRNPPATLFTIGQDHCVRIVEGDGRDG